MKKGALAVFWGFLFFSLPLTSCNSLKVIDKQKPQTDSEKVIDNDVSSENKEENEDVSSPSKKTSENVEEKEVIQEETLEVEEITEKDFQNISYAFGHFLVNQLKTVEAIRFDVSYVTKGMEAAVRGEPSPLSEEDYEREINRLYSGHFKNLAIKNLSEAELFLKKNKQEENVVVLVEDKLHYKIIQQGIGEEVISQDSVIFVHYQGSLLNKTVFSLSEKPSEPIKLTVKQTIPGISQGMEGMRLGERRILYIHPDLGYKTHENLPIPPNSLILFEVEIVEITSLENTNVSENEIIHDDAVCNSGEETALS